MFKKQIGVLALQGDVSEHFTATRAALKKLKVPGEVVAVRDQATADTVAALIIPGGESTVLFTLIERAGILEKIKTIPRIFGTCAGAILLAKRLVHGVDGQKTLSLMDMTVDRNAYGRQEASFETVLTTALGKLNTLFIRAPRIVQFDERIKVLAKLNGEIVAGEQSIQGHEYLFSCFHPELTTTAFHEYFLQKCF